MRWLTMSSYCVTTGWSARSPRNQINVKAEIFQPPVWILVSRNYQVKCGFEDLETIASLKTRMQQRRGVCRRQTDRVMG